MLWDETRARKDLPDSFYFWLMVTEFFNDRVGDVYRLGPVTRYEDFLPTVPSRLAADGTLLAGGTPVRADYALVTCRTPVAGTEVAQAPRGALRLVRARRPAAAHRRPRVPAARAVVPVSRGRSRTTIAASRNDGSSPRAVSPRRCSRSSTTTTS